MIEVIQRACKTCKWRRRRRCAYKYRRRDSALRKCINAARNENLKHLEGLVGEVGAGKNSLVRSFRNEQFKYVEIRGKVSNILLEDNTMDVIVAGQCMEHWYQRGDTLEQGLTQIHRVLKPGGLLYIDVPIHSHGLKLFKDGDIDEIMKIFPEDSWEILKVEKRRIPCAPLAEVPKQVGDINPYPLVIVTRSKNEVRRDFEASE